MDADVTRIACGVAVAETRVRIAVAVLAFSLQIDTFERAKSTFGGSFGGRLQEDPCPGTRRERVESRAASRPGPGRLAPVTGSSDGTAQGERERVRLRPQARGGRSVNHARRQQCRRLSHAAKAGLGSVIAALFGLVVASAGAAPLAGLLLLTAAGLGLYARHWLSLAGRSRVGARSESEVRRALAPLRAEGWRLRHSLTWHGGGDIDSVAITPTGIVVAIETKCAARRPVVSPAQPGGTRREVLGSNGLPGSER